MIFNIVVGSFWMNMFVLQLKKCCSQYEQLYSKYNDLYRVSFDADPASLHHVQLYPFTRGNYNALKGSFILIKRESDIFFEICRISICQCKFKFSLVLPSFSLCERTLKLLSTIMINVSAWPCSGLNLWPQIAAAVSDDDVRPAKNARQVLQVRNCELVQENFSFTIM